jgi:hypothetical protein
MPEEIPEFGGSVTFDFDGNVTSAEVHAEVPGASGGDPLQYEHDFTPGHDAAPSDPGWMPDLHPAPELDILNAPVPEGWHRDSLGIQHPDIPGIDDVSPFDLRMRSDEPAHEEPDYGPGDYPEQQGDEYNA